METFRDRATKLIVRGLRVIILAIGTKAPNTKLCRNGAKDATDDALTVAIWDKESPDAGVAVVAQHDTAWFLDVDNTTLIPADLLEDVFCVETGSGKHHYYFRHNDETRTWRNVSVPGPDGHEGFSVRVRNEYVCGPGSIHPDTGKPYFIKNDVEIAEPSEAILAWLRPQMVRERPTVGGPLERPLHKDFSPEKFLAHYGLKYKRDGDRYHVHLKEQGCPVAGRLHKVDGSTKPRGVAQCTFIFDGGPPGFSCLSGGCHGKGFKDAVSAMLRRNPKIKAFPVWEKEEEFDEIHIEWGHESERAELEFLWPGVLPIGKLIHLGGNSAQGKSPVTVDWAARITTGRNWPDGAKNTWGPRSVLIANTEDDWNDTILPRFDLASGDAKKFGNIAGRKWTKGEKSWQRLLRLDEDIARLKEKASSIPDLAAVIIDPISNYLGSAKMNSEAEVRTVLSPLADLARELRISVINVGHFNRREKGTDPLHRLMGAAAFGGVARAIYLFGQDPDSEDKYDHVMTVGRSCSGDDQFSGLKYKTTWNGKAVGILWGEKSMADAVDVVDPANRREKGKIAEAAECLRAILVANKGKAPARTCINEMKNAGFDLERMDPSAVRYRAKVLSTKNGKNWEWYLATKEKEPQPQEVTEPLPWGKGLSN